jgi:adenylate cyclase
LLLIYLKINGLGSISLADPQKFEEIRNVYFLKNINIIYVLVLTLVASFFWQLKSFFGKEIAYHGDTINTTSRICASAHMQGKNILISKALHDKLNPDIDVIFDDLGEHSLKGKDEKIHIYSI